MREQEPQGKMIKASTAMLYGVILFLTQLLITQWTIRAAGNRDVIDYVSFSGTLTSMLLAVLAIVYSYFTTAGQKSDADRIAAQIASLGTTIQTLDNSESRLANELTRLAEIREKLDDVGARVDETGQHSKNMERLLAEVRAHQEASRENARITAFATAREVAPTPSGAPANETSAADTEEKADILFAKRLASTATEEQAVMLHAAFMNTINHEPTRVTVKREIEPYIRENKKTSFALDTAYGEIYAYSMINIDLGVDITASVTDAFKNALAERMKRLTARHFEDSSFDPDLIVPYLHSRAAAMLQPE